MNTSEHLTTINYHVAETLFGTDKFSDDDTNQTQSDIDLHDGEQIRNVGGQNDLVQDARGISVKCRDEFDFIRRCLHITGVEV